MSTWYGGQPMKRRSRNLVRQKLGDPNRPKDAGEFHFLSGRDGSVSRRQ